MILAKVPVVSKKKKQTFQTKHYLIEGRILVDHLNHPWGMDWISLDSAQGEPRKAVLITERNGGIWVMDRDQLAPIQNLPKDVFRVGQGGWFDLLVVGKEIYLSYAKRIKNKSTTSLLRFRLKKKGNSYRADKLESIFDQFPPLATSHHYGGSLTRDDKSIFLSLGDRGQRKMAQERNSHPGNIMRRDLGKHFLEKGMSVYSYGHRNVQGFDYDWVRKKLFATEHGPQGGDELNLILSGRNYGWPAISYGKEYGSSRPVSKKTHQAGMEQPIKYWDPSPALSGLMVYRGNEFPEWQGSLFLGSLKYQRMYRIELKEMELFNEEEIFQYRWGRIRSITQDPDRTRGSIYLLTDSNTGKLIEITRAR